MGKTQICAHMDIRVRCTALKSDLITWVGDGYFPLILKVSCSSVIKGPSLQRLSETQTELLLKLNECRRQGASR